MANSNPNFEWCRECGKLFEDCKCSTKMYGKEDLKELTEELTELDVD